MKFSGLILLLLIAVSAYFSWDETSQPQYASTTVDNTIKELETLKEKAVVKPENEKVANRMSQQLQILATYQAAAKMPTDFIALAPTAPVVKTPTLPTIKQRYTPYAKPKVVKRYKPYAVSMIFIAPNNRYAVIDERFSKIGDVLPDGGKVTQIEEEFVKVKRGGRTETFRMSSTSG